MAMAATAVGLRAFTYDVGSTSGHVGAEGGRMSHDGEASESEVLRIEAEREGFEAIIVLVGEWPRAHVRRFVWAGGDGAGA
jgi:hypothetical protein